MGRDETEALAEELETIDSVEMTEPGMYAVEFSVDYGKYDALPSQILSILAEHGGTLYSDVTCKLDYTVVV
jgi:hypothetical protein